MPRNSKRSSTSGATPSRAQHKELLSELRSVLSKKKQRILPTAEKLTGVRLLKGIWYSGEVYQFQWCKCPEDSLFKCMELSHPSRGNFLLRCAELRGPKYSLFVDARREDPFHDARPDPGPEDRPEDSPRDLLFQCTDCSPLYPKQRANCFHSKCGKFEINEKERDSLLNSKSGLFKEIFDVGDIDG
eukprot:GHVP01057624.1.p1 GENE.GHVP01057624.1~~GHVP01057624.1.p1  ORF type:complete len:187 (+),score=5.81 GHVP01057624.1:137-697(+)